MQSLLIGKPLKEMIEQLEKQFNKIFRTPKFYRDNLEAVDYQNILDWRYGQVSDENMTKLDNFNVMRLKEKLKEVFNRLNDDPSHFRKYLWVLLKDIETRNDLKEKFLYIKGTEFNAELYDQDSLSIIRKLARNSVKVSLLYEKDSDNVNFLKEEKSIKVEKYEGDDKKRFVITNTAMCVETQQLTESNGDILKHKSNFTYNLLASLKGFNQEVDYYLNQKDELKERFERIIA